MDDISNMLEPGDFPDVEVGSGLVEYETNAGEYWAVENFSALAGEFGMGAGDLAEWHDLVAGEGRAWEVIQRLYGVASLGGEVDADFARGWKLPELAKKYGVKEGQLRVELDKAVRVWKVTCARANVANEAVGGISQDEYVRLVGGNNSGGLDKQQVDGILKAFGFGNVPDEMIRAETAGRILSLREYLEAPHHRVSARRLISLELGMHTLERLQLSYQNQLDKALSDESDIIKEKGKVGDLEKKIDAVDAKMAKLTTQHSKLQKDIGAEDVDLTTKKVSLVGTVAYIMEECRKFEDDPENWKVDGVFTAGQVNWLMEPSGERPAQYRPDIVVRVNEAMRPENLWNPRYEPTTIQQAVVQKMRKIAEGVEAMRSDAKVEREIDEEDDGEDEIAGAGEAAMARVSAGDVRTAITPETYGAVRGGGGDDVMGIF